MVRILKKIALMRDYNMLFFIAKIISMMEVFQVQVVNSESESTKSII